MFKIIKEAFSDTFPDWLKKALNRKNLVTKRYRGGRYSSDYEEFQKVNIAWDEAVYYEGALPNSARGGDWHDDNKLKVFRLMIPSNYNGEETEFVVIPGVLDPDLSRCSEALGYDRFAYDLSSSKVSYKRFKPFVVNYGYILLDESNTLDKIKARKDAKAGSIERDRKKGQHAHYDYIGDGKYSEDPTWVTDKGYDKSGYKLDPEKYVRMLAQMDVKDTKSAARRIEGLYQQIEDAKARAAEFLTGNTAKALGDKPENEWSTKMELVSDSIRCISRAVDSYKELLRILDKINSEKGKEKDEGFERWYANDLQRNSEQIKDYLEDANKYLNKIK